MKWTKGLPPIHRVEIEYLFRYKYFNDKGDIWWYKYFLATPIDPKLEECDANNLWYFDISKIEG